MSRGQVFRRAIVSATLPTVIWLLCAASAIATTEYADRTGRDCGFCHVSASGGGELTAAGEGYLLAIAPDRVGAQASTRVGARSIVCRVFRLGTGYLHILTGILWFGTILYVHLILKPAYASRGLPRGEVRVGLVSIAIMAITGALLTADRFPHLNDLVDTRFGMLLLAKIAIFSLMSGTALFVVTVVGPRLRRPGSRPAPRSGKMTPGELRAFDGKEGRPAYLAYKGKVYDVTHSPLWSQGTHMGRHQAGQDLTEFLAQAPHDEDKILGMPVVAELVLADQKSRKPTHERVFFVLAYLNLICVLLITLIIAMWRWA
jgi:predicted heme/steroid binding protein